MNPQVLLLVVGWLVRLSVCQKFLKGRKLHSCSYRSTSSLACLTCSLGFVNNPGFLTNRFAFINTLHKFIHHQINEKYLFISSNLQFTCIREEFISSIRDLASANRPLFTIGFANSHLEFVALFAKTN